MAKKDFQAGTKIKGGVTAAKGFQCAAASASIKKPGVLDMGLLLSDVPCGAAGTFTSNAVRAYCVDWNDSRLPSQRIRAVLCNSGNANACTGPQGVSDARHMVREIADACDIQPNTVLVASTGVIGHSLPMQRIAKALPQLATTLSSSRQSGSRFARSIMTTDTRKKEHAVSVRLNRKVFVLGGCAKGSGMICPNMATMLAFLTTDAAVPPAALRNMLRRVVDRTFNNLTVDGDSSTNDMVVALANGVSGVTVASPRERAVFEAALFEVCNSQCAQIAADGEGATKRVEVRVTGATTFAEARAVTKAIANSNLVKTAMFGNDPNWGRILCAIGYSGARLSKKNLCVSIGDMIVCKGLRPVKFANGKMARALRGKVVPITVDLGRGDHSAIAQTCDFSYDYVRINAEYTT